jgi:hypothetical protein
LAASDAYGNHGRRQGHDRAHRQIDAARADRQALTQRDQDQGGGFEQQLSQRIDVVEAGCDDEIEDHQRRKRDINAVSPHPLSGAPPGIALRRVDALRRGSAIRLTGS